MKEHRIYFRKAGLFFLTVFLLTLLLAGRPTLQVHAASQSTTSTTKTSSSKKRNGFTKINGKYYYFKNGKKLTNTWKTINGYRYYFGYTGAAATGHHTIDGSVYVFRVKTGKLIKRSTPTVVKNGDKYYCVNSKGQASIGWFTVTVNSSTKLCYANKWGQLVTNTTLNGIQFGSDGYAVDCARTSVKIKAMSILSSITTSGMTNSQKLYAAWKYVTGGRFTYWSSYPNLSHSDWVYECALSMLTYGGGNCYGFACTFAVLAQEIGYDCYVYVGRVPGTRDGAADGYTRHAWCYIGGGFYDPEAQYAGWCRGIYGYGSSPWGNVTKITHLV